jgi:tetratricopeptide (TPR) repeat protein
LDDTFQDFSRDLRLLSEEDLQSTTLLPSISNRALWQAIIGNGIVHPLSHLGMVYSERGDRHKTVEIEETILEDLQSLDESSRWRSTNIYNLACAYSLAGFHEKAIEQLKEALQLNPELTEWSTHDPDLAPLRELADYKKLYSNPTSH